MRGEEKIRFPSGALSIEGNIAAPPGATRAVVICHPHPQYGGSMDNNVVIGCLEPLVAAGFATLRFNFRGVGASEGSFGNVTGEVEDTHAAIAALRQKAPNATLSLVGYSFGALVSLFAGAQNPHVTRIATVAAPIAMFDLRSVGPIDKPLLFLAGDRDNYCPLETLRTTLGVLGPQASLVPLSGADHFFSGREREIGEAVVRFLSAA